MIRRIATLVLALTASANAAPPAEVTVDQAVALLATSPRMTANRAAIDVAAADVVDARQHPNPTLDLSGSRTVAGSDTINGWQPSIGIDVPILIGHQRARRGEAARDRVTAARAEVAATTGDAELDVRARFAALLVAQEQQTLLAAALADARTLREIVAGRSAAGAGSPYAVQRIELAISELASRLDEANSARIAAAGELAATVGAPGWQPHALGALDTASPGVTASPSVTGAAGDTTTSAGAPPASALAIDANHPQLVADRAAHAAALAEIEVARADAVPTPTFGLHAFTTSDPNSLALSLGVSIPLPLFDKNRGAIARARADATRTELELAARQTELTTALDRATSVLAARRDAAQRFAAELQRLPALRTMAETSYRSGQGGIVELLDALDAITDARLRDLELRSAVAEAALDVRRAARGH